jgi:hypothetical protein
VPNGSGQDSQSLGWDYKSNLATEIWASIMSGDGIGINFHHCEKHQNNTVCISKSVTHTYSAKQQTSWKEYDNNFDNINASFNMNYNKFQSLWPSNLVSLCNSEPWKKTHGCGLDLIPGQVIWDLWWTKWHCGRFSLSTSVSLANSHLTNCSTFINHHIIDIIQSQYLQNH